MGKDWPLVVEITKGIAESEEFILQHDASISLTTEQELTDHVCDGVFVWAKVSGECDDYGVGKSAYVEDLQIINEENETINLTAPQIAQIKKVITQLNVGYK